MTGKIDEPRGEFFKELVIRLSSLGFDIGEIEDGLLPVRWHGEHLCFVSSDGNTQYNERDMEYAGAHSAINRVTHVTGEVAHYMHLMEAAPSLKVDGLNGNYKLLVDFNGVILAGHPTSMGVNFITWEWAYEHTGVWGGHYYGIDFAKAKQDFAIRAGLIDCAQLFSAEQLTEISRSIHETLDSDYPITEIRRGYLESAAQQIEQAVPDLDQRVNLSNQREMELNIKEDQ